jgi:flagellin
MNAMNAHRNMAANNVNAGKSMEKLSSGLRINKAGDDAAGLAISEKMRGQIRGLDQASRNSQDAISMIQTAEGGLNETHSILQRMRELSVQSSTDTNTAEDRASIQKEMNQLGEEVQRIGDQTEFNNKKLLNGDMGSAATATAKVVSNSMNAGNIGATLLTGALDASGNSVGIAQNDVVTVTWSVGGTQKSATLTVGAASDFDDLATAIDGADATVAAAMTGSSLGITSSAAGTQGAVNGFSIEVKDASGVRKEAASNALSNFTTTTEAKDNHADGSADFQIGANTGQKLNLAVSDMRADALGVRNLQVGNKSQAATAIKVLDQAISTVSTERAKLGANQNRLEHTISNLNTSSENLTAAESRIRDVDMAKEMMQFSKNNILSQAAQAMISQANQQPQGVLQLLR